MDSWELTQKRRQLLMKDMQAKILMNMEKTENGRGRRKLL
jgi:hypothetical protein